MSNGFFKLPLHNENIEIIKNKRKKEACMGEFPERKKKVGKNRKNRKDGNREHSVFSKNKN